MFNINLEKTSKISTAVGTAMLSYAGIRMLTKKAKQNNKQGDEDCVCEDGTLCPVLDPCSRGNLQLGFVGIFVGNAITVFNYIY